MQKKFSLGLSIIIVLLLIMTSVVGALNINPFTTTNQSKYNPLIVLGDPYPQLDAFKQVWNGTAWVDEITATKGTIVRFNITIQYHDIDPLDNCYKFNQIAITDYLGDFEYIGNPWISENGKNPDNYLQFNTSSNILQWNFYGQIWLSERLTYYNTTLHLEFDAKVNDSGSFRNYVEVNGLESCCGRPAYSDADAFVNVSVPFNPAVDLTKYVKDDTEWVKSTSADIGDIVSFKLLINNTGNVALTNVHVTDDLPAFLLFMNDANITPATSSAHHIEWNLGTLAVDQTIEITFSTQATTSGEADNNATVTSNEGPTDNDIAHITVMPQGDLRCTKTVWDPDTQQWVEQLNADLNDTVRFNITLTYVGQGELMNITIVDLLPTCLEYANNASRAKTGQNNKRIFWNLSDILTNGQSISIEFDALVISSGTNINTVNISALENCFTPLYCQDTATVRVEVTPPPDQNLQCEKKVWDTDTQQWVEQINADMGDTVRFKINVSYWGSLAFYYIWINDTLPTCLNYSNNATPYQPTQVNGKEITWYLPTFLRYGQNISIEFNATVISEGVNINIVNITGWECGINRLYCEDTATVIVNKAPPSELPCSKKVWDPDTQQWVKQINAEIGDTVRFNITFIYHGAGTFSGIKVVDTLPACLEYANNASLPETGKNNKILFWNLSDILTDGQGFSIEFDALVISSGTNINTANITGHENCITPMYCEDTATVIVKEPPRELECEKTVWDPDTQHWVEQINADIGDTVRFNITLTYTGDGSFANIRVIDILPACLQYANNADPVQTAINNNRIFWNLSDILTNGQSISIEFNALVISSGTNINTVNITGYENCITPMYCEDTATVIVEEPRNDLECEKKVWDTNTTQWVEEINAEVGDMVRFKIFVSYWGALAFYNIWINDTLPTCLEYMNNATPYQPTQINGKVVIWHPDLYLKYGENITLEFDALVISAGTNINIVNITGIECGIRQLFCEDTATVLVEKQPDPLVADAKGPYDGYVSESVQMTGSATGGVAPYTYTWDLNDDGAYDDGIGTTPTYTWGTIGTKTIHLKVTDTRGINDTDTAQVTIIERNIPPNTPSTPVGPESGRAQRVLTYSSSAVDPNGDMVYLQFDWGDGNTSGWLGPFTSGSTHEANHTYTIKGTYTVKVKAKDTKGEQSAWSNSITINIKRKFIVQETTTILDNLKDRFPTLENLLTALLHIIETMRLNHSPFTA